MASRSCDSWAEIPSGACDEWAEIDGSGGCDGWVTEDDWILITGFWQDIQHYWRDLALWQDGTTNWVPVNG